MREMRLRHRPMQLLGAIATAALALSLAFPEAIA